MIDITLLRAKTSRQQIADNLAKRGVNPQAVEQLAKLDEQWRQLTEQVDDARQQKNQANDNIAKAEGKDKERLVAAMRPVSARETAIHKQLMYLSRQRDELWRSLPNTLMDEVPIGGEGQSKLIAESKIKPRQPDFSMQDYLSLSGEMIDTERAAKVSGSRFVYLKGQLARLEMALISHAFDQLTKQGFIAVVPPVLLQEQPMRGMGYLDHQGEEIYKTQDALYLIGTSEQSIGAMHMNEVIDDTQLPKRYVGFSTCFRREAGSHGKDVKGILRVHQFDKVEMFSLTAPDQSAKEHEFLLAQQRQLMDGLELPYRVMNIASDDLGAPAAKTFDIETWMPGEKRYRETHSASNTTDWQARRLHIRTKTQGDATTFVHMLNGTAFAIGRTIIALVENHQQADGSIKIPEVLHPYLPFTAIAANN